MGVSDILVALLVTVVGGLIVRYIWSEYRGGKTGQTRQSRPEPDDDPVLRMQARALVDDILSPHVKVLEMQLAVIENNLTLLESCLPGEEGDLFILPAREHLDRLSAVKEPLPFLGPLVFGLEKAIVAYERSRSDREEFMDILRTGSRLIRLWLHESQIDREALEQLAERRREYSGRVKSANSG